MSSLNGYQACRHPCTVAFLPSVSGLCEFCEVFENFFLLFKISGFTKKFPKKKDSHLTHSPLLDSLALIKLTLIIRAGGRINTRTLPGL